MSIETAAIEFMAATKKRAQARSHLSTLRKKWIEDNDTFFDKSESNGMEGHADMMAALHDRELANAEYRLAKSRLFRACAAGAKVCERAGGCVCEPGHIRDDYCSFWPGSVTHRPTAHPMRDGYAGSVLTSGKEGHALLVRYATREQADAAQDWLTDALAGFDGVIHLYVEDAGLRQSLLDSLRAYGVAVKEVPSGT